MENHFRLVYWKKTDQPSLSASFTPKATQNVISFHASMPGYKPTPLCSLQNTANKFGVKGIFIKDESKRFDLNAFKILGGSYAIASILAQYCKESPDNIDFETLKSKVLQTDARELTFITATDGNHGRGVARSASLFGCKSIVYMPKGSVAERVSNIQKAGAQVVVTDLNYDDTVRLAAHRAKQENLILVQDTSFPEYEQIPLLIMQGYCTMAAEAYKQLPMKPTHIFLQAGVGSMAAAVAAYLHSVYQKDSPTFIITEPHSADCFYQTAAHVDGNIHPASGDLNTIMAGLACGEPCELAWELLTGLADAFVTIPDSAAAEGMRLLARPFGSDQPIVAGESGASAFGCATEILRREDFRPFREALSITEDSVLLFFNTEGATDTDNYNAIVCNK